MLETIAHFFEQYWFYGYLIVFLGMIFEGAGVALFGSFLAQQGHLNIYALFPVMFAGAIVGNIFWYQLGKSFHGTRIGGWFRRRFFKNGGIFENILQKNSLRTLFISKFIYGFDRAAVILSGLIKLNFPRFLKIEIFTNVVWLAFISAVGYSSGAALGFFKSYFKRIEIVFLIVILIFIIVETVIKKKLLHKIYNYLVENKE